MVQRKTGEIIAVDANGNRYTIIKYTDFESVRTFGASETVTGVDDYRLKNGEHVNQINDTEFVIVTSEIKLRKV